MNTDQKKDIILVDDHIIIRDGLKQLIEKLGPYQVSRQYDNGATLVEGFPLDPTPDLIVMDITMPEMDGDEVVLLMKQRGITIPVLILSLINDENRIIRLFRNGVRGYLQKDCTAAMMKEALEQIFKAGFYHNELMTYALQAEWPPRKTEQEKILDKLSPREREFLKLVCNSEEYTYVQIANLMNVQHRTVDGYREIIFEKFGIKSKSGMVLFVLRHQLIEYLDQYEI